MPTPSNIVDPESLGPMSVGYFLWRPDTTVPVAFGSTPAYSGPNRLPLDPPELGPAEDVDDPPVVVPLNAAMGADCIPVPLGAGGWTGPVGPATIGVDGTVVAGEEELGGGAAPVEPVGAAHAQLG
jgi:hypothetical protein